MKIIDLHTHSTYSDGTLTPTQLVKKAENIGLYAIALTDHDTVSGLYEFEKVSTKIIKVPGVEISVQMKDFNFHMVGLFIDVKKGEIEEKLKILQKARAERNKKIIEKLKSHGFKIDLDELKEIAGEQLGRPHIAFMLTKKGYFSTPEEAFEKCLKKGAFAYVEKFRFSPDTAIKMIKNSKGLAILAHPGLINISTDKKIALVDYLKNLGLDGIEVFYSDHTKEDEELFMKIAKERKLLISGGSDYHGENKKGIELGFGRGNLSIDFKYLEEMLKFLEVR